MRSLAIMAYLFLALASYAWAAGKVPAGQEPKSVEARKGSFNAAGKGFYLDPRLDSLSQTSIASLAGRLSLVSGKISTVVTGISASATPPDKGLVFLLDQSQPSEAFEVDVTPSRLLVKMPDDMDWVLAAMAEPLTISLHGVHRGALKAGEHVAIYGAGTIGVLAGMVAQAYGAHATIIDLVQERLDFAKSVGVENIINSGKEDVVARINEITNGVGAQLVMECTGANPCIRQTLDIVSSAGRITFTGWPSKETSLPTDMITKKEVDIRGARTSAGEFEEAIELINSGKVDIRRILTKVVSMDEAPETIRDIEKNPGNYLKVVVNVGLDK